MIKTTYICDGCYKEIPEEKTYKMHIEVKYPKDYTFFMNKDLELCPKCADKLTDLVIDFITPKGDKQ